MKQFNEWLDEKDADDHWYEGNWNTKYPLTLENINAEIMPKAPVESLVENAKLKGMYRLVSNEGKYLRGVRTLQPHLIAIADVTKAEWNQLHDNDDQQKIKEIQDAAVEKVVNWARNFKN